MKKILRFLSVAALLVAAGCASVSSVAVAPERVGVCSWSWRLPIREVSAQMDKAGVKGIHLALGPFIAPDGRHGSAEDAATWEFVKAKVASGEWKLMSTMIGFVGEDYSTLETIRLTGRTRRSSRGARS